MRLLYAKHKKPVFAPVWSLARGAAFMAERADIHWDNGKQNIAQDIHQPKGRIFIGIMPNKTPTNTSTSRRGGYSTDMVKQNTDQNIHQPKGRIFIGIMPNKTQNKTSAFN